MIALPGFVDSHRHTWQSLLRGVAIDWTLAQYFAGIRGVMGRLYTPDDMYVANHLGALEALDAGITTLYDWSHNNNTPITPMKPSADSRTLASERSSAMATPTTNGSRLARFQQISPTSNGCADRISPSDDELVTMAFAARGRNSRRLDITADEFRRARDLGLRITVHVGDGLWGTTRPVLQLASRGLLGDDITYVHCNTLTDEDFRLIGHSAATASISPEVELQMGHGFLATLKLIDVGVRPSLSIDIVTSIAGDMFGAMRMLLAGTRAVVNDAALRQRRIVDPLPLMSRDVLEFATIQGARACGLEALTGSLTPGKEADIVLIDTDSLNLMPLNNPHGVVVECAHAGNVDTVMVAGEIVKRDKRLLGINLQQIRARVDAARDALFRRASVSSDGSWLPRPFSEGADVEG